MLPKGDIGEIVQSKRSHNCKISGNIAAYIVQFAKLNYIKPNGFGQVYTFLYFWF